MADFSDLDLFENLTNDNSNVIDIDIESLEFIRPISGTGKAGTFKFKKLNIQNSVATISLENEDHAFDSTIYIRENRVGIKGPLAKLTYRLDEENTNYLHSFKWANVVSTQLLMNTDEISLKGLFYEIRKPESLLRLENFSWDCLRHEDYLENDSTGFLSGCLNYGKIYPLYDDDLIDISFSLIDPDEKDSRETVKLESKISGVEIELDRVTAKSNLSVLTFKNDVRLISSEVLVNCDKPEDLISINAESLLVPCLNDLQMESELLGIYLDYDDEKFFNFETPKLRLTEKEMTLTSRLLKYESPLIKFKIKDVKLVSRKDESFSVLDINSYKLSLFNKSLVTPSEGASFFHFSVLSEDTKGDEAQRVTIESDVERFEFHKNKISIKAPRLLINQDDSYFYHMNEVELDCFKESNILEFDVDKVLSDCKYSGNYSFRDILIDDQSEGADSKYFLEVESLKVNNGHLSLLAPGFQLIDKKENMTLINLNLKCRKTYEKDLFNILDVLEDCFEDSSIFIGRIVSEENEEREETRDIFSLYEKMIKGKVANPLSLIRKKDAFIKNAKININKNRLSVDVDLKLLGVKMKVKADGIIILDRETETIVIDIEKVKLPLSKSKKIFMFLLRKNVANDTISFEDDGKIYIKL